MRALFARTRYKPLIDVDPMVQVAGIRIYYNLFVPRHVLLEPQARQCDRSTEEARNKTCRCATWIHVMGAPRIIFFIIVHSLKKVE